MPSILYNERKDRMLKITLRKRVTAVLIIGAFGTLLMTGCASKEASQDSSLNAASESSLASPTTEAAAAEETLSEDELKAAFSKATPYDGEVKIVVHSAKGDESFTFNPNDTRDGAPDHTLVAQDEHSSDLPDPYKINANLADSKDNGYKWIEVTGAVASSTLHIDGYDYSVWNMLDWKQDTIWAEGSPGSKGVGEGFAYFLDRTTRIDGLRIYPGFQQSKSLFRNNYLPTSLEISLNDQLFTFDLDGYLRNIYNDGEWFWVDTYFSKPVYADRMYVMISNVTSYGNDPDTDCCITEFHPFQY